jgi:hypothetical protein
MKATRAVQRFGVSDDPTRKIDLYHYLVEVAGYLWLPHVKARASYTYYADDDDHAAERVDTLAGDFSGIVDYEISVQVYCRNCFALHWEVIRPWADEENEYFGQECEVEEEEPCAT